MNIKWVTPEEYAQLVEELEQKAVWPRGWQDPATRTEWGFKTILAWDVASGQQVLVKVAETELLKELL